MKISSMTITSGVLRKFEASLLAFAILMEISSSQGVLDPEMTLDCHRRPYSHKVTQFDSQGRMCWDSVTVMSCWGRCDSNEISDWRFPYIRSTHPVCIHGDREPRVVSLANCDEGTEPGTEVHTFMEAISCSCSPCKTSEASCEGLRYRGQRNSLGFQRG